MSLAAHWPAAASLTVTTLFPVWTREASSFWDTESYFVTITVQFMRWLPVKALSHCATTPPLFITAKMSE